MLVHTIPLFPNPSIYQHFQLGQSLCFRLCSHMFFSSPSEKMLKKQTRCILGGLHVVTTKVPSPSPDSASFEQPFESTSLLKPLPPQPLRQIYISQLPTSSSFGFEYRHIRSLGLVIISIPLSKDSSVKRFGGGQGTHSIQAQDVSIPRPNVWPIGYDRSRRPLW